MCPNLWLTESEPRGTVHTAFIENLGGVRMQVLTPVARWVQMAALGAAIYNAFNQVVGSVMLVSKTCRAWQPSPSNWARKMVGTLKPSHMYVDTVNTHPNDF